VANNPNAGLSEGPGRLKPKPPAPLPALALPGFAYLLCLWEWRAATWHLVRAYACDEDGHRLMRDTDFDEDRCDGGWWVNGENVPAKAVRAVTSWSMEYGVLLRHLSADDGVCQAGPLVKWAEQPDWSRFVRESYVLRRQTAAAAEVVLGLKPPASFKQPERR